MSIHNPLQYQHHSDTRNIFIICRLPMGFAHGMPKRTGPSEPRKNFLSARYRIEIRRMRKISRNPAQNVLLSTAHRKQGNRNTRRSTLARKQSSPKRAHQTPRVRNVLVILVLISRNVPNSLFLPLRVPFIFLLPIFVGLLYCLQ